MIPSPMPGGSVDRLFASCVYTLAGIHDADSCICPVHIEPKAPTPVNKTLGAATPGICGEMPQPGKLFISVRFGAADSPCRKFLGPWYAAKKAEPGPSRNHDTGCIGARGARVNEAF